MAGGKKKGGRSSNANDSGAPFQFNFSQDTETQKASKDEGSSKVKFAFDVSDVQQALVPLLKSRLGDLVGKSSGYLESLPIALQNRILVLKQLHRSKVTLDQEFKQEMRALENKYRTLFQPMFDKRNSIVNGETEPTDEEIEKARKVQEEEAHETDKEKKEETEEKAGTGVPEKEELKQQNETPSAQNEQEIKGIPDFWLTALKHSDFSEMITEKDEEALRFLKEIKWKPLEEQQASFVLEFYFRENPFFDNTLLAKTYHLLEKDGGSIVFDKFEATDIKWKPGKNLTVKKVTKHQGGKRGGRRGNRGQSPKTITVEEPCESFFNFFHGDDLEDAEDEQREMMLEEDYEVGLTLKEEIIPNAILWFTGEAEAADDDEDDDDDEEEDDDDDNEDDEDDEENEDDDEDDHHNKKNNKKATRRIRKDEEYKSDEDPDYEDKKGSAQPDCKQQ